MSGSDAGRSGATGRVRRLLGWAAATVAGVAALPFGKPRPASQRFDEASGRGTPTAPASEMAVRQGYETRDMSGALMMWLTMGLGAAIAVMIGLMLLLVGSFHQERRDDAPRLTAEQTAPLHPPKPNLQADPVTDLARLHAGEDALLHGYAWIDPGRTHARIPIKRAMTLMVGHTLEPMP